VIYRTLIALLLLPALLLGSQPAQTAPAAATFRRLGNISGGGFRTFPQAVSNDGQVVVGYGERIVAGRYQARAFRWTPSEGVQLIAPLPGYDWSFAYDVSADGRVIVGESRSEEGGQAFRWTSAEGAVPLGFLPGATEQFRSAAHGISADGSVIVGTSVEEFGGDQAFRWTAAEGMQPIPFLYGGQLHGIAYDVSDDGRIVVGTSTMIYPEDGFMFHHRHAFRWTAETGTVDMHPAQFEEKGASAALAITGDGRKIIGEMEIYSGTVWTTDLKAPALLFPPPVRRQDITWANVWDISADGKRIVGSSHVEITNRIRPVERAMIWESDQRPQDLQKLLERYRVRLRGWTLIEARSITRDGRTLVGFGKNPQGQEEGWIATLPAAR